MNAFKEWEELRAKLGWMNSRDCNRVMDAIRSTQADVDVGRMERGSEAFAAGGMDAYNDAMGHGVVTEPEPCGHHCPWDCPRCGGE